MVVLPINGFGTKDVQFENSVFYSVVYTPTLHISSSLVTIFCQNNSIYFRTTMSKQLYLVLITTIFHSSTPRRINACYAIRLCLYTLHSYKHIPPLQCSFLICVQSLYVLARALLHDFRKQIIHGCKYIHLPRRNYKPQHPNWKVF